MTEKKKITTTKKSIETTRKAVVTTKKIIVTTKENIVPMEFEDIDLIQEWLSKKREKSTIICEEERMQSIKHAVEIYDSSYAQSNKTNQNY